MRPTVYRGARVRVSGVFYKGQLYRDRTGAMYALGSYEQGLPPHSSIVTIAGELTNRGLDVLADKSASPVPVSMEIAGKVSGCRITNRVGIQRMTIAWRSRS
jgi:hypothetical protein